jgi:DNA mismatch repair protein MutS2
MLSPKNIEEKIGFDRIRDKLQSICKTSAGKDYVDNIRFSVNIQLLISQLNQTSQFQKARQSRENLPDSIHADAAEYLKSIMAAGTFLEPEQLLHIGTALTETEQWLKFLKKNQSVYPDLSLLLKNIDDHKEIQHEILSAIDKNGEIKNSASPTLKKIRSELISQQVKARKSLDKLVAQAKAGGIIPDDASLTVRGGRLVVPVKAEFKRSFKGFIHDESSTGSIAYIEPAAVLELNNTIRDLEYQEKREVIRILTKITDHIRPEVHSLHAGFDMLAKLDFIRAKAIFSDDIHAIPPQLQEELNLRWIRATHPILEETLRRQEKQIVPLNIELKPHQRILVISGPNAGGKSVCLKTVGLLQYMLQCGLHIPVAEGSSSTVFEDMLIDIGDEQSIENDLSTYSSHLKNMANFLRHGGKHSLFLIDEFGSGTDPQFGGAIAEAILEILYKKGMYGLVTTHYSNLKKMAEVYQDMANARMRFDVEKLEPLFRLETGKPGSSFSLEIAGKIGLPSGILKKARNHIGTDQIDMERLLNKLEIEKKFFEDKNRDIKIKQKLLDATLNHYDDLKKSLENQKKIILNEAKTEALNLLKVTNQKTENLIRRIRENRAEKESTKTLRKEIKDFEKEIQPELLSEVKDKKIIIIKGNIRAGNKVRVKGKSAVG